MSRTRIVAVLLSLLLLVGCGKKVPSQKALDFRTSLLASESCSFTAKVRADYGEKLYDFTLRAEYASDETRLTVQAPEEIAGISAVVSKDGTKLEFDDIELDFGKLANGYVSPVTVPWLLGQCWAGEYISCAGADGDLYRVTYLRGYDEEELTVDTWFDADGVPVYAEVSYGGQRCITVQVEDFQM